MKWRVYIDEAGNRGMSSRSSDHFTVAAVIVPDQRDAAVRQELAIRLLLERISWYCRDHEGGSAIVTFAHVRHFPKQKLHDYRRALERAQTLIHWDAFEGHKFRIGAPSTVELLQFADIAASALFRAVEPDDYGNVEPRYLQELAPMLYRRPPGDITSYGVKVFPSTAADAGSMRWLRGL